MGRLTNIQHLRAIAALTVVFSHLIASAHVIARSGHTSFAIPPIFGTFGVDVFFVISGFIMYYTTATHFGEPGATVQFLRRRLIRIVPIYWLLTLLQAAVLFASRMDQADKQIPPTQLIKSFFFIPYLSESGKYRPILGVGWTLNFEMLFYVVFALTLLFPRRIGVALLFLTFASAISIGQLIRPSGALGAWTMPVSMEFLAGVLLAAAYIHIPGWVGRIRIPATVGAIAIVLFQHFYVAPTAYLHDELLWRPQHWGLAVLLVLFALAASRPSEHSLTSRVLERIGDSSYSLYLTHTIWIGVFTATLAKLHLDRLINPYVFFFATAGLAVVIGWLFHVVVEERLTQVLSRRGGKRLQADPLPVTEATA
ncbi:MAG: acyltransferase [Novosphingobium sp.]